MKRDRILIALRSNADRSVLRGMLSPDYEIIEAESIAQAQQHLHEYGSEIVLSLLDLALLRSLWGYSAPLCPDHRSTPPTIAVLESVNSDRIGCAFALGALDFLAPPFDIHIVRHRVANALLLSASEEKLAHLAKLQTDNQLCDPKALSEIFQYALEIALSCKKDGTA